MFKVFVAFLFTFQGSINFAQAGEGFERQAAFNTSVAFLNASADNESLLNSVALATGKTKEVAELKTFLGPKFLKGPSVKLKRVDANTFSTGKSKFTYTDGKLVLDGKVLQYSAKKTLLENFKKNHSDLAPAQKKTSKFELLMNSAYADDYFSSADEPWDSASYIFVGSLLAGGSISAVVFSLEALPGPILAALGGSFVAGVGMLFYAGEVDAAEGIAPIKSCEKKGDAYINSFKHVSGQIITEEYKPDQNGNLIVTVKSDGEVVSESTIVKKGDTHSLIKMTVNNKAVDLSKAPTSQGQVAYKTFASCSDPIMKKRIADDVEQFAAQVKSGKIKLVEGKKVRMMVPAKSSQGTQ
jgi:hypothetical protein